MYEVNKTEITSTIILHPALSHSISILVCLSFGSLLGFLNYKRTPLGTHIFHFHNILHRAHEKNIVRILFIKLKIFLYDTKYFDRMTLDLIRYLEVDKEY